MLKAYRLRNALLTGQLNGEGLESILQIPAYKSAMQIIAFDWVWFLDLTNSETAMAAVAASETAMAVIFASKMAMAAVWESSTAIHALNDSAKAKTFLVSKSTTIRTQKNNPNLPKGKILVTKVCFTSTEGTVALIKRAGGSIDDTPIKNDVATDQIVIQAIIDCDFNVAVGSPWTNISYIQVAQ